MALQVTNVKRSFTYKKDGNDMPLPDPNRDMSAAEVMKFYSSKYPELTTGVVEGPVVVNDVANYRMTTKAGKLG